MVLEQVWCPYTGHRLTPCKYAVVIPVRGNLNGIYASDSLEDCRKALKAVSKNLQPRIVECLGYRY